VAADLRTLVNALDVVAKSLSGTASARPTASATLVNTVYRATDTGEYSICTGAAWTSLIPSRGAVNISASQSTTSATSVLLSTPDEVSGIVLPANGLLAVWYQATWSPTSGSTAEASLFLNGTAVDYANMGVGLSPTAQYIADSSPGYTSPLTTCAAGLQTSVGSSNYTGDVSTGQILGTDGTGGPCYIFAAAGTYTVSVQFLNSGSIGTTTVANRKLWVQAVPFA